MNPDYADSANYLTGDDAENTDPFYRISFRMMGKTKILTCDVTTADWADFISEIAAVAIITKVERFDSL